MPREKDKRVKLTDAQRVEILHNVEGLSQYKLAAKYGVSRRLIGFIQKPDALAANLERRAARGGWKQYYNKDEHNKTRTTYRHHTADVLTKSL